jgi:hypothetical protein
MLGTLRVYLVTAVVLLIGNAVAPFVVRFVEANVPADVRQQAGMVGTKAMGLVISLFVIAAGVAIMRWKEIGGRSSPFGAATLEGPLAVVFGFVMAVGGVVLLFTALFRM